MQVVIINGMPRAGKDLFVEFCQKYVTWCKNVSTVDFVKEVAKYCGWDGTKTPENRAFLSNLKDLLTQWNDIPLKQVKREIEIFNREAEIYGFDTDKVLVFVHCREPHEIAKLVKELGAITLLIRRELVETADQSNHADAEVFNYQYDYCIHNDGSLEEYEQKAVQFLHDIQFKLFEK